MTVAHPSILALGYSPAAMLLRGPNAATIGAIISISGAREPLLETAAVQHRLNLHFDDVDVFDAAETLPDICRYIES